MVMDSVKIDTLLVYDKYINSCDFKEPLRTLRKIIRNLFPLLPIMYSKPESTPCDILFLQYAPSIPMTKGLRELLRKRGFQVRYEALSAKRVFLRRKLCKPDKTFPAALRYYDAVLKFLMRKYSPKLVCSLMDYSILSSLLKQELANRGGKYINIAHGPSNSNHAFSMFDFDYYFLFGKKSLNRLLANPVRIGNTKVVLAGSPFITSEFCLPPNYEKKNLLFFSQLQDSKFYHSDIDKLIENTRIVVQWAQQHPEFHLFIKPHPAENPQLIGKLTQGIHNITIFDKSVSMVESLRNVSLALNMFSSASIEAAVLNRPVVVVSKYDTTNDFFSFKDFFLPRATTVEELHHNIIQTFERYDEFLQKTQEFAKFHLEHTTDSVEFIADCIESIYHGKEDFECIPISEELSGLQPYL